MNRMASEGRNREKLGKAVGKENPVREGANLGKVSGGRHSCEGLGGGSAVSDQPVV